MKKNWLYILLGTIAVLVIAGGFGPISYYPSVSVSETNFVNELQVTNGITVGGVRNTTALAPLASPALTGAPTMNGQSLQTQFTNKVDKTVTTGQTVNGPLTSPEFISAGFTLLAPETLTPIDTGVVIDFSSTNLTATLAPTGNVLFAYANLSGTLIKTYNILVANTQATNCSFTFPANTRIMGIAAYQSAGKGGRLTFEYWPSLSTNVFYIENQ